MMEKIWNPEGPVMGFLEKCGQLIVLSVLWLLGCLPIVTVCTSNAALYYAVMKSVRRGQGSAVREFWRSYRMNLLGGSVLTILFAAAAAALMALSYQLSGGMYPVGVAGIGWILILFVFSSGFGIPVFVSHGSRTDPAGLLVLGHHISDGKGTAKIYASHVPNGRQLVL